MNTDVIIIGMGPAGATAAIYVKRAGLDAIVFEGFAPGGQVSTTDRIENYPGYVSIEGYELAMKFAEQAKTCGADIRYEQIESVDLAKKTVTTSKGSYTARAVIICGGAKRRNLGVDGEEKLIGRGVSYCAVCDGGFYKDKLTAVVGGGDTAVTDAIYLSRLAKKVYLIHRRDEFRAARSKVEQLKAIANVEFLLSARVTSLNTDDSGSLSSIDIDQNGSKHRLDVNGLFVAVGSTPDTTLYKDSGIEVDTAGYIVTNEHMETSLPFVYAAGDIRSKPVRQIITAASDGAVAAVSCAEALESLNV